MTIKHYRAPHTELKCLNFTLSMCLVRTDSMSRKNTKTTPTAIKGYYSSEVRVVLRVVKQSSVPEATCRLIDKPALSGQPLFVLKSLNSLISPHRDMQRRVRVRAFRVLTVLISYMDWATFRIGVPKRPHLMIQSNTEP